MCSLIRTFNVHTKIQNSNSNWNSNWNRIWFTSERGLVTHWSNEWMRFFLGRIWMFFRTQHDMEFWQCQNNHGIDGGFIIWSLIILINLTIFWYFFFQIAQNNEFYAFHLQMHVLAIMYDDEKKRSFRVNTKPWAQMIHVWYLCHF